ncbi:O-antigen ligase family protein [Polynucleobacter campilacus]|uniref:O-antigen ligase-related domain-containing protein n=1 Tax=Polynucleobacter campilacus TaxID=1743163 RepID=A0A254Q711_9BURK|nr:O-antigen ligase family protein [Polynucleobacter campilacus]OWS70687.1 hypothetical protein CBI31_00070 [Polynucleobacter campilacus]
MQAFNAFNLLLGMSLLVFPARILGEISLLTLKVPDFVGEFGTVYPIYSLIDLLASIYLVIVLILLNIEKNINRKLYTKFVLLSFISIIFITSKFLIINSNLYLDGLIFLIRTVIIYNVWILLPNNYRYLGILFSILIGGLVALVAVGTSTFQNERINIPGFEITSSSYALGVMILLATSYLKGPLRGVVIVLGILMMIVTASRIALLLLMGILIIQYINSIKGYKKILVMLIALSLFFGAIEIIFLMRADDNNYSFLNIYESLSQILDSYSPYEKEINQQFSYVSALNGRLIAILSGIDLVQVNFPWPLGSDWAVQEGLQQRGFPSHTHSGFLQLLLKNGVLALPIFLAIIQTIRTQFQCKNICRWATLYISISLFFDYIFFVPSIMAIFLLLCSSSNEPDKF